ncbi:MAG: Holliday junction DNA helicase RuvB C-terminal domain-containing protein [bacterium]|nr:Holliday junction DNA helicase RuvB C-terminal domain-containing protein [bacterium]
MINEKEYLRGVIGIEPIKKQISFYLRNFETTGIFKNLLVVGAKGVGKTKIIRETAKHLVNKNTKKIRKLIEINCASLKNLSEFIDIVSEHIVDCENTVYLDESEELDRDISIALLSILEINEQKRTQFVYGGGTYVFDFRRVSFIFSTTDPQKMLSPLVDRLEVVNLPAYDLNDLGKIVAHNLLNIQIDEQTLENLATVTRGNPRSCIKLTDNIKDYLKRINKDILSLQDCKKIYSELSIFPLGLNQSEVQILQTLKHNPCSLTRLAAILGGSTQMIRRFDETFLLKTGLIEIIPKGRKLTPRGLGYLKSLQENP